jgi:hypothetical protein
MRSMYSSAHLICMRERCVNRTASSSTVVSLASVCFPPFSLERPRHYRSRIFVHLSFRSDKTRHQRRKLYREHVLRSLLGIGARGVGAPPHHTPPSASAPYSATTPLSRRHTHIRTTHCNCQRPVRNRDRSFFVTVHPFYRKSRTLRYNFRRRRKPLTLRTSR